MSWFSSFDPNEALNKLNEISSTIQSTVLEDDLLNKLTLNSPEMLAERSQIDAEEKRKEMVRDYLSELLPWETKNEELGIFTEECRDRILELSISEATFLYPFQPSKGVSLFGKESAPLENDDNNGAGAGIVDDKVAKEETSTDNNGASNSKKQSSSSPEALMAQKLSRLEPLPPLLDNFDLDVHVGLIERLLKEDTNLKEMQLRLTGAGEKEYVFWKNYFFHCAYARYEKGLSIDELWASKPEPLSSDEIASGMVDEVPEKEELVVAAVGNSSSVGSFGEEEDSKSVELTFEQDESPVLTDVPLQNHLSAASSQNFPASVTEASAPNNLASSNHISESSISGASYDFVDKDRSVGSDDMDDLEAEIARELGEE